MKFFKFFFDILLGYFFLTVFLICLITVKNISKRPDVSIFDNAFIDIMPFAVHTCLVILLMKFIYENFIEKSRKQIKDYLKFILLICVFSPFLIFNLWNIYNIIDFWYFSINYYDYDAGEHYDYDMNNY